MARGRRLGLNMGVYNRLDAADKSAYKESVYSKYLKIRKNKQKEPERPSSIRGGRPKPPKPRPLPPKQQRPKKYQTTEEDKMSMTGSGYYGLGPGELNRRIAQNEALADVAFSKVSSNQKNLTAEDQAHVYRGLKFQGRADLFRKAKNYGKP